jgi:hypothetical protein
MRACANNEAQNPSRGGVGPAGKNSGDRDIANDSDPKTYRYTVLYYKRKNKVHKSRGVSKLDGTLIVVAASPGSSTSNLSVTLQSADTGAVVYRGGLRINGNTAERGGAHSRSNDAFDVDETVSVGAYEVEILSCDSNGDGYGNKKKTNSHPSIASNNKSKVTRNRKLLDNTNARGRRPLGKKLGIGGGNQSRRGGLGSIRSLAGMTRKPTLPPTLAVRKRTKTSSVDSESSDDGGVSALPPTGTATLLPSLPSVVPRRKANTILPGYKRPILRTKTDAMEISCGRSSNAAGSNRKRRAKLLSSPTEPGSTTQKDTTNGGGTQNFFPGAIGTPLVPHSIRKSLRPHQIEGVVFLWNCLTGNGQVASFSPHIAVDDTEDEASNCSPKGCILSDGKQSLIFGSVGSASSISISPTTKRCSQLLDLHLFKRALSLSFLLSHRMRHPSTWEI